MGANHTLSLNDDQNMASPNGCTASSNVAAVCATVIRLNQCCARSACRADLSVYWHSLPCWFNHSLLTLHSVRFSLELSQVQSGPEPDLLSLSARSSSALSASGLSSASRSVRATGGNTRSSTGVDCTNSTLCPEAAQLKPFPLWAVLMGLAFAFLCGLAIIGCVYHYFSRKMLEETRKATSIAFGDIPGQT